LIAFWTVIRFARRSILTSFVLDGKMIIQNMVMGRVSDAELLMETVEFIDPALELNKHLRVGKP
jgi:hypothetical protein